MVVVKTCVTCRELKPLDDFNRRAAAPDGRQDRCRACCREWYRMHRDSHLQAVARRKDVLLGQLRERLVAYLREHPCVDCGTDDVRVLDFDHREPQSKVGGVGEILRRTLSWSVVRSEIAKCDVRCANCHRRRTVVQLGWWRATVDDR